MAKAPPPQRRNLLNVQGRTTAAGCVFDDTRDVQQGGQGRKPPRFTIQLRPGLLTR